MRAAALPLLALLPGAGVPSLGSQAAALVVAAGVAAAVWWLVRHTRGLVGMWDRVHEDLDAAQDHAAPLRREPPPELAAAEATLDGLGARLGRSVLRRTRLGRRIADLADGARRELAELRRWHLLTAAALEPAGGARFWSVVWDELGGLAGTPLVEFSPAQRRFRHLVVHALTRPVDERGDWSFLDRSPGWLADRLAQHRRWAAVRWPQASVRDRLALAALAVLGDGPAWLDGEPGSDEMQRQLVAEASSALTDVRNLLEREAPAGFVRGPFSSAAWRVEMLVQREAWGRGLEPAAAAALTGMRRELAVLVDTQTIMGHDSAESMAYWASAWAVAERSARVGIASLDVLDRALVKAIVSALDRPFPRGGDWAFLQDHGWLAAAMTDPGGAGAPRWLRKHWAKSSNQDRLSLALLVAVVGPPAPAWLTELPKSRRSHRWLGALRRWSGDQELVGAREQMVEMLTAIPDRGSRADRSHFVGAWISLALTVTATDKVFVEPEHRKAVRDLLRGLVAALPARGPPRRAELLARAQADVLESAAAGLGPLYGARLDPLAPLPFEPGSALWDVVVGYRVDAGDALVGMLARYLETWQATGSRQQGNEAAWARWRDGFATAPVVARDEAPTDQPARLGSGTEVVVGAEHDVLEILQLGYPRLGGSCLDCVSGKMRRYAQGYVLAPHVVVLYAWSRTADGLRGERMARLSVVVTEDAVVPLGQPYTSTAGPGFGPAFDRYLRTWAETTGKDLLFTRQFAHRPGRPDRLTIPEGAVAAVLTISVPALGVTEFYADVLGGLRQLPTTLGGDGWRWRPPGR